MIHINPRGNAVEPLVREGHLVLFSSMPFTHLKVLRQLPIHSIERWKKFKSRDALSRVTAPNHPLFQLGWAASIPAAERIQRVLRETEVEARNFMRGWFPSTQLYAELHSWRYTVTKDEPLHFDTYAERVTTPVLRLFVNLDTEPRVWDVGPISYSEKDRGTFDPVYKANVIKDVPVERVEFPPGSAWVVESYRVAHAIIHGRRAAMFTFETERKK